MAHKSLIQNRRKPSKINIFVRKLNHALVINNNLRKRIDELLDQNKQLSTTRNNLSLEKLSLQTENNSIRNSNVQLTAMHNIMNKKINALEQTIQSCIPALVTMSQCIPSMLESVHEMSKFEIKDFNKEKKEKQTKTVRPMINGHTIIQPAIRIRRFDMSPIMESPTTDQIRHSTEQPRLSTERPRLSTERPRLSTERSRPRPRSRISSERPQSSIRPPLLSSIEEPRPSTEQPRPSTEQPRPSIERPRLSTERSRPRPRSRISSERPQSSIRPPLLSSIEEPWPSIEEPRPSTEQPRPSTEQPRPSTTEQPRPSTTEQPRPSTEQPQPSTEPPRRSIEPPRRSIEPSRRSIEPSRRSIEPSRHSTEQTPKKPRKLSYRSSPQCKLNMEPYVRLKDVAAMLKNSKAVPNEEGPQHRLNENLGEGPSWLHTPENQTQNSNNATNAIQNVQSSPRSTTVNEVEVDMTAIASTSSGITDNTFDGTEERRSNLISSIDSSMMRNVTCRKRTKQSSESSSASDIDDSTSSSRPSRSATKNINYKEKGLGGKLRR